VNHASFRVRETGMTTPTQRKPPFSMIRTFALADLVTLANGSCGTCSMFFCLNYVEHQKASYLWWAFGLLPIALICDVADGSIARWRRKHSALGADLDSLADVVSFGVAPAVLGFTVGLRGGWDTLILIFFVACGISRLARYNVTAAELSDETGKVSHYEGTPIPTSLLLVGALAIAFATKHTGANLWLGQIMLGPWELHPLSFAYLISGSLMISTIPIPKP
jgi:CDP-diacylglycerol---serine O-phosphatidyltransferase